MFAIELQSRLAGPPAGGKCRSVMLRLSYAAHPHPFVVKPNSPDPHAPRQLLIRYAEGERGCAGDAEAKPRSVQSAHRGIKPAAGGFCAAITIGNDPRYPLGSIRRAFPPRLPLALQGPGAAIPSRTWCLGSSNFSDMCLGRPRHRRRVAGHGPAGGAAGHGSGWPRDSVSTRARCSSGRAVVWSSRCDFWNDNCGGISPNTLRWSGGRHGP